ncbi:MAG: hydroxyacylglutathione hydrolase [Sandaracinaceae bacterium]|nr:hydroxyacylglutathione hydrolase [Sandaracinaceae bacterium]
MRGVYRYTVRCEAKDPILLAAIEHWLKANHIGDVLEAGALEAEVVRLEGENAIEVRYAFAHREAFERYEQEHAPRLRLESRSLFGDEIAWKRSQGATLFQRDASSLRVRVIPYFRDNYAYLVHPITGNKPLPCIVVDPGDALPILQALERYHLVIEAIFCTHHHADHVGGLSALLEHFPSVPVYGSEYDMRHGRIPFQNRAIRDGDTIQGLGYPFQVMEVPGHTIGAITYVGPGFAFTGDTLFLAGCGRVFEGTMDGMYASLMRLATLPQSTLLYVGHEYTQSNLRFAQWVEPNNQDLAKRIKLVSHLRAHGQPTVPSTLKEELATNPFLRCSSSEVMAFAASRGVIGSEAEVFAEIRRAKDAFT